MPHDTARPLNVIGVDTGLSGGIVALSAYAGACDASVHHMPVHSLKANGKSKTRLDLHGLLATFQGLAAFGVDLVVIEDVSGRPPGALGPQSGAWRQGFNAAAPQAMAVALGMPVHLVAPAVWKRRLGVPASKDGARAIASNLLPNSAAAFRRAKDDGVAEAALLALYGLAFLRGEIK